MRAKRESQELELQLRRNDLHSTEDVEHVMTDCLVKFKARLMAIPAKLSPIIAKKNDLECELFTFKVKNYIFFSLNSVLSLFGVTII